LIREKNFFFIILGLSLIIGMVFGINQGINTINTSNISEILTEVDTDIKIQITTSDYDYQYNLLKKRLIEDNSPIIDSFQTCSSFLDNSVNITKDLQKTYNISNIINSPGILLPKLGIYGMNISKFFFEDRFENFYNFLEGNISSNLKNNSIIISKKLSTNLSINLGDSIKIINFDLSSNISIESCNFDVVGIIESNSPKFSIRFKGPEGIIDRFNLGMPFSFSSAPFIEDFFIFGNFEIIKILLSSIHQNEMNNHIDINILLSHDVEFFNFNHYRSQINDFSNNLEDFLKERIDPSLSIDKIYYKNYLKDNIDHIGENLIKFEWLLLANLIPVFLFALLYIFFLRESSIFTRRDELHLLHLRGLSKNQLISRLVVESFILNTFAAILSLFFGIIFKNSFLFFLNGDYYINNSLLEELTSSIDSLGSFSLYYFLGFVITSISSIWAFKKHESYILYKETQKNYQEYRKMNILMIILGGFVPIVYFCFKIYKYINNYSIFYELINGFLFLIVTLSPIILILGLIRLFSHKIFLSISLFFQQIIKNKYLDLGIKNMKKKKVNQILSLVFLISFCFSYGIMTSIIQNNQEKLEEQLIFNEIGGDFTLNIEYDSKLNQTIYNTCLENQIRTTDVISITTNNYEINENDNKDNYHSYINLFGISVFEYFSIISDNDNTTIENFTLFEELEKNLNGILVSKAFSQYNDLKIGDNISINNHNSTSIFNIIGFVDIIPAILTKYSMAFIINKENSIIKNELSNITEYVEIRYIFKIDHDSLTSLQAENLIRETSLLSSFGFSNRDEIRNNLNNPSLSFGTTFSTTSLLDFNSLLVFIVSLAGILVILNNIYQNNFGNFSLLVIRGLSKKELLKIIFLFLTLLFISSIIIIPIGIINAFLYFQSYYFNELNLFYASSESLFQLNIFNLIIQSFIKMIIFIVIITIFIYFKIIRFDIENKIKYMQKE